MVSSRWIKYPILRPAGARCTGGEIAGCEKTLEIDGTFCIGQNKLSRGQGMQLSWVAISINNARGNWDARRRKTRAGSGDARVPGTPYPIINGFWGRQGSGDGFRGRHTQLSTGSGDARVLGFRDAIPNYQRVLGTPGFWVQGRHTQLSTGSGDARGSGVPGTPYPIINGFWGRQVLGTASSAPPIPNYQRAVVMVRAERNWGERVLILAG